LTHAARVTDVPWTGPTCPLHRRPVGATYQSASKRVAAVGSNWRTSSESSTLVQPGWRTRASSSGRRQLLCPGSAFCTAAALCFPTTAGAP